MQELWPIQDGGNVPGAPPRLRMPTRIALPRIAAPALVLLLLAGPLAPAPAAQAPAERAATRYLQANWNRHGLAVEDVAELVVTDRVPGPGGTEVVYVRQAIGGVEVASGPLTVAVDRGGRVVHAAGRLTRDAQRRASGAASLPPEAAATALAAASGVALKRPFEAVAQKAGAGRTTTLSTGGVTRIAPEARLVYAEADGALRLAWETTLFLEDGGDWFGHVDAATGRVLRRVDLLVRERHATAHAPRSLTPLAPRTHTPEAPPFVGAVAHARGPVATGGAAYRAYPAPLESVLYATGGRELISGVEDPAMSPYGWHDTDGIPGAEFTITRGNNAHAYLDRDDDEAPDVGGEPDGGGSLLFDFPLDLSQDPTAYTDASVVNLFYWTNLVHDVLAHYGFDEASGNFQETNYSGRGAGADAVDAESQSGADVCNEPFPCDTNANFSTPREGQPPRMQMYVGSTPTPTIDGSFDHGVIVHEIGHGVTNRLTGGPGNVGCLFNAEQMGEGWSDFFGLMLTMRPGDTGAGRRPIGNYLIGQDASGDGIRSAPFQGSAGAPYSTDFAVNAATYGDTNAEIDFAAGEGLTQPHGVGFVWATALWEMTWALIDAHGFDADLYDADGTAGNQIAMSLVMGGLKLQPCSPGFVDGRDAILRADEIGYGGAYSDLIWEAFARRGLGRFASQGSSESRTDQVESFVVPEDVPPAPVTDLAVAPGGDFVTLTFTASGDDGTVGTAEAYLVRASSAPILSEADWDAATPLEVLAAPSASGTPEAVRVGGLTFDTAYHFALRVRDDNRLVSELSNPVAATTLGPPEVEVAAETIRFAATPEQPSDTAELSIQNTGESELSYTLDLGTVAIGPPARPAARASGEIARHRAPEAKSVPAPSAAAAPARGRLAKGAGGPDAFGYAWADSDEPGGPAYRWVDISETGTEIEMADDDQATVALPFAFPFYGAEQAEVTIVSNGYLTFGAQQISFRNEPIPTADVPNAAVFAHWADLDPGNVGSPARVLYHDTGDGRFAVTWEAVPFYRNDGALTFQVVLHADGTILLQYEDMAFAGRDGEATIGIENAFGTDGLQVAHKETYARDRLAVRVSSFWGDAEALSGTVASGATETVTLTADASGLAPGTYAGTLTIRSNDPATPVTRVPLELTLAEAAPVAALSPGAVSADVPRGETAERTVTVSNAGTGDLDWALGAASGDLPSWLAVSPAGGTLSAGESAEVTLTMAPGTAYAPATTETAALALTSNDPGGALPLDVTMNVLAGVGTEGLLDFEGPYVLGEVAPNPIGQRASAAFAVREAQTVTAEVLDLLGRRVALVHEGAVPAMTPLALEIDAGALASGAYVLVVRGDAFTASRRVTVAR